MCSFVLQCRAATTVKPGWEYEQLCQFWLLCVPSFAFAVQQRLQSLEWSTNSCAKFLLQTLRDMSRNVLICFAVPRSNDCKVWTGVHTTVPNLCCCVARLAAQLSTEQCWLARLAAQL